MRTKPIMKMDAAGKQWCGFDAKRRLVQEHHCAVPFEWLRWSRSLNDSTVPLAARLDANDWKPK
jgi:hypothetical protein